MKKRGRPEIKKVPISKTRLVEALKYRNTSLRKLNNDPEVNASEKTIRRALQEGFINPEIIERLGKRLDVDPNYLQGVYDIQAEALASDATELAALVANLDINQFPYTRKEAREMHPFQIIMDVMTVHQIPASALNKLPLEQQVKLYLEMEKTTSHIIRKYFPMHKSETIEYPMPDKSEITHMD